MSFFEDAIAGRFCHDQQTNVGSTRRGNVIEQPQEDPESISQQTLNRRYVHDWCRLRHVCLLFPLAPRPPAFPPSMPLPPLVLPHCYVSGTGSARAGSIPTFIRNVSCLRYRKLHFSSMRESLIVPLLQCASLFLRLVARGPYRARTRGPVVRQPNGRRCPHGAKWPSV